MEKTPTAINQYEISIARIVPAIAAITNEITAACLTDLAVANPDATSRTGPTRLASVPFMPSE